MHDDPQHPQPGSRVDLAVRFIFGVLAFALVYSAFPWIVLWASEVVR